ncbi:MAG: DUF479 domain-containing protein [Flavobacteriales bacterium]|nr:DUF479 domain-containing protein [Flavobacteriales bacterium]
MNFLGHLYLSGDDPLIIVGNFMADAVKGRDLSHHPEGIQRGIRLHRAIDVATDAHPMHRVGRERVRAHAGRYAGVVMDLFYDHLLAIDWQEHHPEPLEAFSARMYRLLEAHHHLLPQRTREMLPWMMRGDWLTSYATLGGIGRALDGLSRRAPQGASMQGAETVLADHFQDYRAEFGTFLHDLRMTVQGS